MKRMIKVSSIVVFMLPRITYSLIIIIIIIIIYYSLSYLSHFTYYPYSLFCLHFFILFFIHFLWLIFFSLSLFYRCVRGCHLHTNYRAVNMCVWCSERECTYIHHFHSSLSSWSLFVIFIYLYLSFSFIYLSSSCYLWGVEVMKVTTVRKGREGKGREGKGR